LKAEKPFFFGQKYFIKSLHKVILIVYNMNIVNYMEVDTMKRFIQVSTWITRETEKAFAIEVANGRQGSNAYKTVWLPKSQCEITHPQDYADAKRMLINIPDWLALQHINNNSHEFNRYNGYCGLIVRD
jgi:hypothetical protein